MPSAPNSGRNQNGITRRNMLASTGAAAAGWALLCDAIGADNPAVQVEDRASSIKITGLAPHSVASFLGIAASFHVAASIPLFLIHEFYPNDCGGVLRKSWEVDKDGDSSLPQGPGLGVEVDEAALAKIPPSPFKWPGAKNPDGSVADY